MRRWFQHLSSIARLHPVLFLWALGAGFSLLSCYPVVIAGRSFINHTGTPALYATLPFVPGNAQNPGQEWYRNADLGATLWSIAPNTVVAHRALFEAREFPWWNRAHGCGVPLWGQGQSMLGDPLHLPPLLFPEHAAAWDAKFILSRAVFASGTGLLVFTHTGNLGASSLATITACFLGAYAFWFNHPATFTLTYAPWLALAWENLGRACALVGPATRVRLGALGLLALAYWCQLNVGAPKEGVVVAALVTCWGMVLFARHVSTWLGPLRTAALAGAAGFGCLLTSSLLWLLFLDALGKAHTSYDAPVVQPLPRFFLLALFDDFFAQHHLGYLASPSLNPFVLACLVPGAWLAWRQRDPIIVTAWAGLSAAAGIALGLVPSGWLLGIPLVNRIHHTGTTFSVPMMVFALYLAGRGMDALWRAPRDSRRALTLAVPLVWGGLISLFLVRSVPTSMFWWYAGGVMATLAVLAWTSPTPDKPEPWRVACFSLAFVVLHIRFGLHLPTGVSVIDGFQTNPTERASFIEKSEAIQWLQARTSREPSRVVGTGVVLYNGYGARLGLEDLLHSEALRNRHVEALMQRAGVPTFGPWEPAAGASPETRRSVLDLLGVAWYLTDPRYRDLEAERVFDGDLAVWQRPSAWPRAFFADGVAVASDEEALLKNLSAARQPVAIVAPEDLPSGVVPQKNSHFTPARAYASSCNRTAFTVEASGPGIVVIGEAYSPGDFIIELDGRRVPYFRINGCFNGIQVRSPGVHVVSCTYRPERLDLALALTASGGMILLGLGRGIDYLRRRRPPDEPLQSL